MIDEQPQKIRRTDRERDWAEDSAHPHVSPEIARIATINSRDLIKSLVASFTLVSLGGY